MHEQHSAVEIKKEQHKRVRVVGVNKQLPKCPSAWSDVTQVERDPKVFQSIRGGKSRHTECTHQHEQHVAEYDPCDCDDKHPVIASSDWVSDPGAVMIKLEDATT